MGGLQGIWEQGADGTDINAVHRSPDGSLLATADDFGNVRVFNYPVVSAGNAFVSGSGHSSHVTNARFNNTGSKVLTTGGNDRSVFQWALSDRSVFQFSN